MANSLPILLQAPSIADLSPAWLNALLLWLTPIMVAIAAWIGRQKLDDIHVVANNRLTNALDQISKLQTEVGALQASLQIKTKEVEVKEAVIATQKEIVKG